MRLVDDNGTVPQKGLWLINPKRQRVAGKIRQVKRSGVVVWENEYGALVRSKQELILDSGYIYIELEPKHLSWLKNKA